MSASDLSQPGAHAPGFESLQQAAEWFAVLGSEDATDADRQRWQAWLDERRENRDAWRYVENVGLQFDTLQPDADDPAVKRALRAANRVTSRRKTLGILAAIGGAGLLGWGAAERAGLRRMALAWAADYRTGVGEIRDFVLPDGTRIWLNTASALDEDFGPTLRLVNLVQGEVLIETAKDAARSFAVDTPHGRLTALGTRFVVRRFDGHASLAVYEGRVEIRTAESGRSLIVESGEQATFTAAEIGSPQPATRAGQAWSRGMLVADNIPLRQLIGELSRYRPGHLGCAPEVAELSVMGTYSLADTDRVLALLEDALPVRIRKTLPWWTTVVAKD
jgi:transmembrane sensor